MPKIKLLYLVVALAIAAAATTLHAQHSVRFSGSDDALWLTAFESETNETHIRLRMANQWRNVQSVTGRPAAQAALDFRLHIFYPLGGYRFYDAHLDDSQIGPWPAEFRNRRILAAAPGRAPQSEDQTIYLLLEVEEHADLDTSDASPEINSPPQISDVSEPSPADETSPPIDRPPVTTRTAALLRRPVLYALIQRQWQRIAEFHLDSTPANAVYHLAVQDGRTCLLICDVSGRPMRLACLQNGQWSDLSLNFGPHDLVHGLASLDRHIFLFGAVLDEQLGQHQATLWRITDNQLSQHLPVLRDDQPVHLPKLDAVTVSRYGRQLAMAFFDGEQWQSGFVDLTGENPQLLAVEPLALVSPPDLVRQMIQYFEMVLMGIAVSLLLISIFRQRTLAGRPFLLPPQMVPASWPKRLLALGIDYMLCSFPIVLISGIHLQQQSPSSVQELFEGQITPEALLVSFISLAAYCVYAFIMELWKGTTLGKWLLQMRVVGELGRRPSILSVAMRNLAKPIEAGSGLMVILFFFWPFLSRYRQRFGDLLARTAVVDRRMRFDWMISEPPGVPPGPPSIEPPDHAPPDHPPPGRSDRPQDDQNSSGESSSEESTPPETK